MTHAGVELRKAWIEVQERIFLEHAAERLGGASVGQYIKKDVPGTGRRGQFIK